MGSAGEYMGTARDYYELYSGLYPNVIFLLEVGLLWLLVYSLFKYVFFKKTVWSLWQNVEGAFGFGVLVFQTFVFFKHYMFQVYMIKNSEGFVVPSDAVSIILRIIGILLLPTLAKFVYMVKSFKTDRGKKLARFLSLASPMFLVILAYGHMVKKIPANDYHLMWTVVALISADIALCFFSKKWPMGFELFERAKFFFKAKVVAKTLLCLGLMVIYFLNLYSGAVPRERYKEIRICQIRNSKGEVLKEMPPEEYERKFVNGPINKIGMALFSWTYPVAKAVVPVRRVYIVPKRIPIPYAMSLF